jgi:hypothetical protein
MPDEMYVAPTVDDTVSATAGTLFEARAMPQVSALTNQLRISSSLECQVLTDRSSDSVASRRDQQGAVPIRPHPAE